MRLEATAGDNDQHKVWMTDPELEDLERVAASTRDYLIIRLGGRVGLRAFEIPQVRPKDVKRTDDGEHYRLRVEEGKDTTGNGGKPRDAYLPADVEGDLHRYQNEENIGRGESFVELSERGIRAVVKRTAERAADETGDDDFRHVSSHDLRRRFAQRLLVDERVNPRVVMQVGGWDSFAAIEPYLNAPTPDVVNEAFEEAGLA
ncbi:site-specific integrase [Haloplanus sp. GCM10025708]|uniref:site-specific integrase n=1 Tax=Haloplanus sp. GCM10025708 TaxID=3252679 RepID=UPI00361E90B1